MKTGKRLAAICIVLGLSGFTFGGRAYAERETQDFQVPQAPAGPKFISEKRLDFAPDERKIGQGNVQLYKLLTKDSDLKNSIAGQLDVRHYADNETPSRPMILKTAYYVQQDAGRITSRDFLAEKNISKLFPQIHFQTRGCEKDCPVAIDHPYGNMPGIPSQLTCKMNLNHSSRADGARGLDPSVLSPVAVTFQTCEDYNMIFSGTIFMNRYYPAGNGRTLVVSYQVLFVKDSAFENARWIPFLNLERELVDQAKNETARLIRAIGSL